MEQKIETVNNEGTIVVEPRINVSGGNVATGDFHQNFYEYRETNPSFSEIDFENEEVYPEPIFTQEVVQLLLKKRILIIKGNNHFDQANFGRKIAKCLHEHSGELKMVELIQNEEDKPLNAQLRQQKAGQVILLNAIHPRHIQYDFARLIELVDQKQSYYIINTESSPETWSKAGKITGEYWFEIPEENHYRTEDLMVWLLGYLSENPLPFMPEELEIGPNTRFSESYDINRLVNKITTPQKWIIFISGCRDLEEQPSDRRLEKMLKNLSQSQEEIITKWFNNLDREEKIIALTAALFNGLFCYQYFEILSQMIQSSFWRKSSDTLEAIDYYNLDFLSVFFRLESTEEGDLIVARNPTTRVNLLKSAMQQYPRHIEKALLIFSSIMRETYNRKNTNWDLHGTTQKRALLRQVFVEATRDIGINQLSNMESVYLELAASDHSFVQGIAAKSLAQYRLFDEDALLFETINKWLKDKSIEERIALFLPNKSRNTAKTILAIKATTIRILAYAADYDQPNQLHNGIVEYLIAFSKDHSQEVQDAVAQVLPKFITHHSYQLRNEIFDSLMPNPAYGEAISDGLMKAYNSYPSTLKDVISHWLSICTKESSDDNRRNKTTQRDNALIAILDTLRKIDISDDGFSLKELYDIATTLLKIEKREAVVESILLLIARIQVENYGIAYEFIPNTIGLLNKKQRKEMVKLWFGHFLRQRKNLSGGEFTIRVFKEEYPAWDIVFKRPLTRVEEALFTWMNSKSKVAQHFATLTFLEIAQTFEREEYQQIRAYRKQREKLRKQRREKELLVSQQIRRAQRATVEVGLGLWLRLKIFFYLLFEDRPTKESLKDIIRVFLAEPYSKEDLWAVIYKWKTRDKGVLSTKLAKWLMKLMKNI